METYTKPFRVVNGRIIDADKKEVRLWGVNYYMPFNHNYINVRDKGVDHLGAIDRDIRDFKRLGIQLVRMHIFDREISDMYGNIVENDHLRVFDYLLDRLRENGFYLMITAMAWWNTVENQSLLERRYAFWDIGQSPAFGFANFWPKHTLIWHPTALDCQERYLRGLFTRKNRFSGKRMPEYDNLVVVEVINEPAYPSPSTIAYLEKEKEKLRVNPIGREENKLLELYERYLQEHRLLRSEENTNEFCASLIDKYLARMFGIVDEYFTGSVLKTHIHYSFKVPAVRKVLKETKAFDCISLAFYGGKRDGTQTYAAQMLSCDVLRMYKDYKENGIGELGKGLISYEWAMMCTTTGFDMGAVAHTMASLGVQLAAYFTYTPIDVAEYNAGWLMQYLNIAHTPRRAVAFAAGGEIFRSMPRGAALPADPAHWETDCYVVDAPTDLTTYHDENTYINAGVADGQADAAPKRIIGCGSSPYIHHEGNGCYILERIGADEIHMQVLPDQFYVNDPLHGKYLGFERPGLKEASFANRFIDVNKVPVVSRLKELGSNMRICYPGFENAQLYKETEGRLVEVSCDASGLFRADPGAYVLKRAPESNM